MAVLRVSAAALPGAATLILACAGAPQTGAPAAPVSASVLAAPASTPGECAWFGDAREGVLYFGISSFWSATRAAEGDPTAEARVAGPRRIGRFDLARRALLGELQIGGDRAQSGVWDVLAHPNGWLYFTTFWDRAGRVDPVSGRVEWLPVDGRGLNELALGPGGRVLATRYGNDGESGSVVVLSEAGDPVAEHVLESAPGVVAAAKSLAFDPKRAAVWVNTDLISRDAEGSPPAHDARVLSLADGRELERWTAPELQFVAFGADGTGFVVERSRELLVLRVLPATARGPLAVAGRLIPLDEAFPAALDFAQDVKLAAGGDVVVTRWSGLVHVVSRAGAVRTARLPRVEGGLYYSGVAREGGGLCATRCAGVEVVCSKVPR